tara:strand:+ start:979 stop:1236 length:258 start_codon:yes stop_codon:yes gene_type:complete
MDRYYFRRMDEGVYFHLKKSLILNKMDEETQETRDYEITREKLIDYFDMLFLQFKKLRKENLKLKEEIKTLQKDYREADRLDNIY